jgi:hypothetical protein
MLPYLVDSDVLEEDLIRHHHYIACKDYDRTIMKKINSFGNLDILTRSKQQDQLKQTNKNSLKTKRIMLVEDEDDIVMLFKMVLESDAGLCVTTLRTIEIAESEIGLPLLLLLLRTIFHCCYLQSTISLH